MAHAPWSERLSDDLLRSGLGVSWISTLAIHRGRDRAVAIDNVRRFHEIGGRVRYGTDMGNGPTPVGVSAAEIRALGSAGLRGDDLLLALCGNSARLPPPARLLAARRPLPTSAEEVIDWLTHARRLDVVGSMGMEGHP